MQRKSSIFGLGFFFAISFCVTAMASEKEGSSLVPYLQEPKSDSITINWDAPESVDSVVYYGTTPSLGKSQSGDANIFSPSNVWHCVQLTGLQPDTPYYYRCKSGDRVSKLNVFRTFPADNISTGHLRVCVYGDSRSNPKRHSAVIRAIRETVEKKYGSDVQNQLRLVINVGDIVSWGTNLQDYVPEYFMPVSILSSNVPFMVCTGNHEAENSYYYDFMNFEGFGGPEGEKYYSFRLGPILFLAFNSNTMGQGQLDWFKGLLEAAQSNDSIDWIIAFSHHPGHTELWPDGNHGWVQNCIIPLLAQYNKVCCLAYGHDHCLAFGAHPDAPIRLLLSGGGGAWIDPWGTYTNQQDYAEVYKTLDDFGYTLFDFDLPAQRYTATTYSLGNLKRPLENVQVDQFTQKRINTAPPKTPKAVSPSGETALPVVLKASSYVGTEPLMSSHFQITKTLGDYSKPILDVRRDRENVYGDTGAPNYDPIDLNAGIDLTRLSVTNGLSAGQTYGWRVRYRDENLIWSEWSSEEKFSILNP